MKPADTRTAATGTLTSAQPLLTYAYLQVLDLLTTIAFLLSGVQEGNPLVRAAMAAAGDPISGLVYVKTVALALGLFCWRWNRLRLLQRVTVLYAIVIAWNLVALIVGLAQLKA